MKRTSRSATLVGAVVAALVTTALGTVGAPSVASTSAPAATSISIRTLQPSVAPGDSGVVAGNLHVDGASPAGRPVALEAQATGEQGFTPIGTATAGEQGGVRLTVAPEVTTRYRWHYAGADDARPRISGVAVVKVRAPNGPGRRLPTNLSVRAVRPVVTPGGKDVVRGTLRAGTTRLRGKYVVLLSRTTAQQGWQYRNGERTDRQGLVTFTVRPKVRTTYRLAFAGTANFKPVKSGVVTVGVRQVVSIAADPQRIDPGSSSTVTGTVTYAASPVAGVTVDLLSRTVRPKAAWAVAQTTTTAADGTVSFTVTPLTATRYRLRAHAAADLPGGSSRVVEIGVRAPSSLSIRGRDVPQGLAVTGQLRAQRHSVKGALVTLQTYDSGTATWTVVDQQRTARNGSVRFVRPSAPGTDYRLAYAAGRFAASTSATLTD
ncbi:hypothetical protein ASC77_04290 [Nocardioides sp. Root1257]|uniref:hypothetical protein n=1 Tax=unclassified Nocardioides TaxID=2615069 RepID=UPI0006F8477C|nr:MULTISPECIES: hypothetical protein [unclassified Nocardioides]KQW53507.1 hypothetical protein ASC77_04290 [Nocardioides sp. Root1257]KRC56193.1 hypothetical protein ASE24_04290 [Nocardioides sp. Root224]